MTVQAVQAACDEGVEVPSNPRRARVEPLHHTPRGRPGLSYSNSHHKPKEANECTTGSGVSFAFGAPKGLPDGAGAGVPKGFPTDTAAGAAGAGVPKGLPDGAGAGAPNGFPVDAATGAGVEGPKGLPLSCAFLTALETTSRSFEPCAF